MEAIALSLVEAARRKSRDPGQTSRHFGGA
jgi:hypothetical protein